MSGFCFRFIGQEIHMKFIKYCLFIVAATFFVSSCGNDDPPTVDENPTSAYSTLELSLHDGDEKRWTLTKEVFNGTDITGSFDACELDNVYIYDIFDVYGIDAGASKCEVNPEEDFRRGYFELNEEEMTMKLGFSDTSYVVDIKELSSEMLQWSVKIESGDVIERTFTAN